MVFMCVTMPLAKSVTVRRGCPSFSLCMRCTMATVVPPATSVVNGALRTRSPENVVDVR